MNLTIEETTYSDGTALSLKGEIDVYTAPKLRERLLPLCGQKGSSVTIDLSQVNYMDSTGLGILIGAYKETLKSGSRLTVTGPSPRVKRLIHITGLDELITVKEQEPAREEGQ